MAFSVTDRGNNNGTGTSIAISSFTPTADTLLVCWAACHEGGISSITGHGTWTEIAQVTGWGGNNMELGIWATITGGSPSASAVTVNKTGSSDSMAAGCFEVGGAKVDGTTAQAFGVTGSTSQYDGTGTSISTTLASFAAASNAVVAATVTDAYNTSENWTAEVGWQGIIHEQNGVAALTGAVAWDDAEDNSPSFTTVHTYCDRAILAIEIIEASGGITASGTPPVGELTASGGSYRTSMTITDVSGDETWNDGDTGIPITGTNFT